MCHSGLFLQVTSKLISQVCPPKQTKECSPLLMQHALLILNNNNMELSHKIPTRNPRKKIFFKTFRFLFWCHILVTFWSKKYLWYLMSMPLLLYTAICLKLFTISKFETCAYWRLICKQKMMVFDIQLFYAHSSTSQMARVGRGMLQGELHRCDKGFFFPI